MDLKKIKTLLEKYYNGETTLDEENLLRDYFVGDQVDDELIAERDPFLYQMYEISNQDNIEDFSDEIWKNIQNQNINKKLKNNNLTYILLRIAASIIIIVGFMVLLKDNHQMGIKKNIQFTDTYNNPEIAYKQAKETLLYVSAMLNHGTNYLEPVEKLNEGTKELSKLKTFNDGLKELDPLSKYNVASKYLK